MPKYKIFYDPKKTPKNKKYSAYYNGKLIHFGAKGYQQYKDTTGLGKYSHLDHNDKKRRERYRARHSSTDYNNPESPAYYSWHYLW